MSVTLSCKLVEVFAVICAVFFVQNQAQNSVVLSIKSRIFSCPHRIFSLWWTIAIADYSYIVSQRAESVVLVVARAEDGKAGFREGWGK